MAISSTGLVVTMVTVGVVVSAGVVGVAVYYLAGEETNNFKEMRGLWVATVDNIDWPTSATDTPSAQRKQLIKYLDLMQDMKMNVMFFQVRTSGDALYKSDLEPWSEWLTGTQGVAPSPLWDPLEFAVSEAHSRGIELHAWINPYRAALQGKNKTHLTPEHMCNRFSDVCYPFSTYMWMDPASEEVLDHNLKVVHDIIDRYNVDGIHVDDYFYPYPPKVPEEFPDYNTYAAYLQSGGQMSKDDWRRNNVNVLIQRMYEEIHARPESVMFTVSPFGLYRCGEPEGMPAPLTGLDPYSSLYSDTKLWLQEGWMDVFIPQIYWAMCPDSQSFILVEDWWSAQNTKGVYICPGMPVYKLVPSTYAEWDFPPEEICRQIKVTRSYDYRQNNTVGHVHFGAHLFRDDYKNLTAIFKSSVYTETALLPWN